MDRSDLVYMAKLAEQSEFDELVANMKAVARHSQELSEEERELLSNAYKNVVGPRLSTWKLVTSIEEKGDAEKPHLVQDFKSKVEGQLVDSCNEILAIIDECLIPNSTREDAKVFAYKMKGDYHRYLAMVQTGESQKLAVSSAIDAYTAANVAAESLPSTHPLRLGVALNFSVLYYDVINSPDRACDIAKSAFDDAIAELDSLREDAYKDTSLIMQMLRDNLSKWMSERADY